MATVVWHISSMVKAKLLARLTAAENLNEALDHCYDQQLEQLQNVRRGIAAVVTAMPRLQLQATHLRLDSSRFDSQAGRALSATGHDVQAQLDKITVCGSVNADLTAQEEAHALLHDARTALPAHV